MNFENVEFNEDDSIELNIIQTKNDEEILSEQPEEIGEIEVVSEVAPEKIEDANKTENNLINEQDSIFALNSLHALPDFSSMNEINLQRQTRRRSLALKMSKFNNSTND